jgi:hypothetical protein
VLRVLQRLKQSDDEMMSHAGGAQINFPRPRRRFALTFYGLDLLRGRRLAVKLTGVDLARSPEATLDELLSLAEKFPEEVLANPALPLLALEAPQKYALLQYVACYELTWQAISRVLERLDNRRRRLFAADCAERVLHLFEARFPGDRRPRRAMEAARQYAAGELSERELYEAGEAARLAAWAALPGADSASINAAEKAAIAAAQAAQGATEDLAEHAAHSAALSAASAALHADDPAGMADLAERKWQLARLKAYLLEIRPG